MMAGCPSCGWGLPPAPTVHPRYLGIWEKPGNDWPEGEPYVNRTDLHDLTEDRWLSPIHAAELREGTLDVPDRTNSDHRAVLVTVPDEASGTQVSWVDSGLAGIVYRAACMGARTVECCEAAPPHLGGGDAAAIWFAGPAEIEAFADAVGSGNRHGWRWYYPSDSSDDQDYAVVIPTRDLGIVGRQLLKRFRQTGSVVGMTAT